MSERVDMVLNALIGGLLMLLAAAALGWYGLVYSHQRIDDLVAYRAAHQCGQQVDRDCFYRIAAPVIHRKVIVDNRGDAVADRYELVVRVSGREESHDVSHVLYKDVKVGDEVELGRFRRRTIFVSHGDLQSTLGLPSPFLPALVGTLLLAALAFVVTVPWVNEWVPLSESAPVPVASVVAVGLVLFGWIADFFTKFDPRYLYISFALPLFAALLSGLFAALRVLFSRATRA
jgi:hypothetical protein